VEINRQKRTGRFRFSLPLFIGLIIVLLSVGNFYFILRGIYGKILPNDLTPNFRLLPSLFTSQKQKVAILSSDYTKNLLPESSTWIEDNLRSWKKFVENSGYEHEIVIDNFIETNGLKEIDLLILPGTKSLSDKEIIKIKEYLENGGNILATGGTASFSNDGKWRGWNFFSEVFGIRFWREIKGEEISKVHTLRGGLPITANIPSGYKLKIAAWDRPIAVEVLDPRSIQVSYWYDYKYEQGLVREEIKKSAGIVYGEYGKGRFVWMGFEINSVIGSNDDHIYWERLIKNSLNWLSRNPITYVRDWPNSYNSAAIFLPYFGKDFSNKSALYDLIKKKQITPTFVVEHEAIVIENRNHLKSLSEYGEVIPAIAFGYPFSLSDTVKNLFDFKSQLQSVTETKNRLEELTGKKSLGVLPSFSLFDNNTLQVLIDNDLEFIIADSVNGNSLPKTLIWQNKKITALHKSTRDDYEVIINYGLFDPAFQFYTYQEDIDRIAFEGGLYIMKIHSAFQLQPQNFNVINNVIDDLRKKNFWFSDASGICKWFNIKNQVEVSAKKMGNRRVRLTISNSGDSNAKKIEVDTDLSEKVHNVVISAEIIGTKLPAFKKLNGGSLIRLTIDDLKPNESRIYYIDYESNNNI
jgi:hypothetical protein